MKFNLLLWKRVGKILKKLDLIEKKVEDLSTQMTQAETDIISKIDTALSAAADRITALINSSGTAQQNLDPDFVAALQAEVDKLNGLAVSTTTPPAAPTTATT